jgi:hypothetical protein
VSRVQPCEVFAQHNRRLEKAGMQLVFVKISFVNVAREQTL